jgi:hypothetical protein
MFVNYLAPFDVHITNKISLLNYHNTKHKRKMTLSRPKRVHKYFKKAYNIVMLQFGDTKLTRVEKLLPVNFVYSFFCHKK